MDEQERERWVKLVADFESCDLTQREFANERGISFSNLRNWIYKLRRETRPLSSEDTKEPRQEETREPQNEGSRLLPVRVLASAAKRRHQKVDLVAVDVLLELALPSGATLRFPAGTDLAYLRALAAAL